MHPLLTLLGGGGPSSLTNLSTGLDAQDRPQGSIHIKNHQPSTYEYN
jgi:hypothetical protein